MKGGMGYLFLFAGILLFLGSPAGLVHDLYGTGCSCEYDYTGNDDTIPPSGYPDDNISGRNRDLLSLINLPDNPGITRIGEYAARYPAGSIITKEDGDLLLVTRYLPDTNRYCTRVLQVGDGESVFLIKDTSFMQLGTSCDPVESIEAVYPYLYDDLNDNTNLNGWDYRNSTRNDLKVYIKFDDGTPVYGVEGYLTPDTPESMKHVVLV